MKYAIIKRGIFAVLGAAVFGGALLAAGCSDWTESRPEFIDKPGHTARYYAIMAPPKTAEPKNEKIPLFIIAYFIFL